MDNEKIKSVKRCRKFGHGVELDEDGSCFVCRNEKQANDRHLAEQKELAAVRAKYRQSMF